MQTVRRFFLTASIARGGGGSLIDHEFFFTHSQLPSILVYFEIDDVPHSPFHIYNYIYVILQGFTIHRLKGSMYFFFFNGSAIKALKKTF